MPTKKQFTKTMYIHRKPGREQDAVCIVDMTDTDDILARERALDYYGVMVGAVEATIEYTDIDADPTDALVAALQDQLTRDLAESYVRQEGLRQSINELLAITHQVEDDL